MRLGLIFSKEEWKKMASKNGRAFETHHLKFMVITFLCLVAFLILLYLVGAVGIERKADFLAYIFPCVAGVLAGAGLFYRREELKSQPVASGHAAQPKPPESTFGQEKPDIPLAEDGRINASNLAEPEEPEASNLRRDQIFYSLSVLALFFGILAYALSHKTCQSIAVVACSLANVIASGVVLMARESSENPMQGGTRSFLSGLAFVFALVSLIIGVVAFFWFLPTMLLWDGGSFLCIEQSR